MPSSKQTISELSNQIWASSVAQLHNIETGLYQNGFHSLGLEPPTINHFDTLLNGYDRKMNYALKQIFKVLTNNNVAINEEINASLYQAIQNMIPPDDKYVQQNVNEVIKGVKTFENYISLSQLFEGQTFKVNVGVNWEQVYFDIMNLSTNKKITYTLGNPDANFYNYNLDHPYNHNEIVIGNKLLAWWNKTNPRLTESTNIGLIGVSGIININSNNDFFNLPTGYTGVANISLHPELKNFNFTNGLIYVEKIASADENGFLIRVKGVGNAESDLTHEGVAYGNRYQIKWTRHSTDFELIRKIYPRGICVFFAWNVNPNVEWQGSGMEWEYIAEDRVLRLGLKNGSDTLQWGGEDDISLQEEHMPPHSHYYSTNTSREPDRNLTTTMNGEHNHGVQTSIGRIERSWYKWSWSEGQSVGAPTNTTNSGFHNHSITIPGHAHYISGTTNSRGSGWGFSIRNKYVKLMGWYRKK